MPRALRATLLPLPALLGWSAVAHASPGLSLAAELEAGAGHDNNIFLSSAPDANAGPLRLGGPLVELAPALDLALAGSGYRLELAYEGDYRAADSVGHLYYQQLGLALAPPELGPVRGEVGLVAGRFDASQFSADRFWFGGAQLGLRVALGDALRVLGSYRLEARSLPAGGSSDRLHLMDVRLSYRPGSRLEIAPRVNYLVIVPPTGADFRRLRAGLDASLAWARFVVSGRAWAGPLVAPSESATYAGAQLEARWQVHDHLDLRVAGDWAAAVTGADAGAYARRSLVLGVVVHGTTRSTLAPALSRDGLRPLVQNGRVRFQVRAPGAAAVTVLGSWDDWATPGRPLEPTRAPGLWELWLALPPGSHRYHFLVDGQPVRPADATRYAPDGFGGEDGVVEIGASGDDVVSSGPTGSYVR